MISRFPRGSSANLVRLPSPIRVCVCVRFPSSESLFALALGCLRAKQKSGRLGGRFRCGFSNPDGRLCSLARPRFHAVSVFRSDCGFAAAAARASGFSPTGRVFFFLSRKCGVSSRHRQLWLLLRFDFSGDVPHSLQRWRKGPARDYRAINQSLIGSFWVGA
jgi:hypothetical protein